jgi:hypothetical protein
MNLLLHGTIPAVVEINSIAISTSSSYGTGHFPSVATVTQTMCLSQSSKPSAWHQDTTQPTTDTIVGNFWSIQPIVSPTEAKLQIPQYGGSGNGHL